MKYEALHNEIQTIFDFMDIQAKDISVIRDPDLDMLIASIQLKHLDAELFLEEREQGFRDLTHILRNLMVKKHNLKTNILFDLNGIHIDFINQTKEKAKIATERVLFFDKEYEFGYLNGYERMIIHSYLQNQPEVETMSHGEGADRRLVIKKQTG